MKLYDTLNPLVSIVLPTYNRMGTLPRAINSVLKQTFTNWELIIVDDGSTDETFDLMNKYLTKNKRIKYLKHVNMKLPIALNNGIAISCGNYITFLGSDDEYLSEHLQLRIDFMRQNPAIDFIHGGLKIIGNPYVPDKNDTSKKIHLDKCVVGGTFFAKREVFLKLNGFKQLKYSEDSEFFERAEKIYHIVKVDFPTYVYHRETEDSITNILLKTNQSKTE